MSSEFKLNQRVYYEDTDAGGIVYHARYLQFCERARTEWLRQHGVGHQELLAETIQIVVSEITCRFHAPAELDDELSISVELIELGACQAVLRQEIYEKARLLVTSQVHIVAISTESKKPVKWPLFLHQALKTTLSSSGEKKLNHA